MHSLTSQLGAVNGGTHLLTEHFDGLFQDGARTGAYLGGTVCLRRCGRLDDLDDSAAQSLHSALDAVVVLARLSKRGAATLDRARRFPQLVNDVSGMVYSRRQDGIGCGGRGETLPCQASKTASARASVVDSADVSITARSLSVSASLPPAPCDSLPIWSRVRKSPA